MSETTKIEWTDATWSPVTGCTRVSAGCDNCYIARTPPFRMAGRNFDGDGPGATTGVVLHPERLGVPLTWRKPRRVFVCSLADLFQDEVPDEYIARVFATMAQAPQHTFQVLTKRPARMRSLIGGSGHRLLEAASDEATARALYDTLWPLPNVWVGVSVENQSWADVRIPVLLGTPAAVRWISAEPLLGPITLAPGWLTGLRSTRPGLDWVVVGGESGPRARPMAPDWARSLRDQCAGNAVPYFFKQFGEWAPNGQRGIGIDQHAHGREALTGPVLDDMGHREVIERVGKKRAGRTLDGRTWDEMPEPG